VTRLRSPILRAGGKGRLCSKLLPLVPPHQIYVEPFCGGASLLFAKLPTPLEIINDIDRTLISFFRMLREPEHFQQFYDLVKLTPYSRAEYYDALTSWRDEPDELERLRKWFVINRQAFGGVYGAGWQFSKSIKSVKGHIIASVKWLSIINLLPEIVERLQNVQIDCVDFRLCIERYDSPDTFFYVDPPYIKSTRAHKTLYRYEMSDDDHLALISLLLLIEGKVMLSGYYHNLYKPLEQAGWHRVDFHYHSYCARNNHGNLPKRTESVWLNYELNGGGK